MALPAITTPVTLSNEYARLEPLSHAHCAALQASVGTLENLWYTWVPKPDNMAAEIDRRLGLQAQKNMLAFAAIDPRTDLAVGMTTYMHVDNVNQRLEIGSTWTASHMQRTAFNTACKHLLLKHAFEDLKCIAVELRTHRLNQQSRAAIERLGAQLDGILRNHSMINGTLRDTAVYSITSDEWPTIDMHLRHKLALSAARGSSVTTRQA